MNGSALSVALIFVAAVSGVAATQPRLAAIVHKVKERDDVFALPPPGDLHRMTLGWDAAAVDLLWDKLLVDYGMHWAEKREFRNIPQYVDAILALEPTYAPLYRLVDTLLAYRPLMGDEDDVRRARSILEFGTRARPDDWRLWMRYGQFLAYVAPSFLRNESDRTAWRRDGAKAIGHAVELGADAEQALSAATLLSDSGARGAAIHFLARAYALTPESSEAHDAIGRRLASLEAKAMRQAADDAERIIETRHQNELPFLDRSMYVLLGPVVDVARCAGPASRDDPACARNWSEIIPPTAPADVPTDVSEPESSEGSP